MLTRTFVARAPLAPGRFAPLPAGAITASGSLRTRLVALRGGLMASCASLFPESGEGSAFFGGSLADKVIDAHPEIGAWFICGHSLGGSFASGYASENADVIEGLILLGSYPYKEYPLEKTLTVYGSLNTSVADRVDYTENVIVIEGGNHAQFGNYGHQDGDAVATVSREHQQELTVTAIIDFISKTPRKIK